MSQRFSTHPVTRYDGVDVGMAFVAGLLLALAFDHASWWVGLPGLVLLVYAVLPGHGPQKER